MSISKKERELLDEALDVIRLHHYSIYLTPWNGYQF